jgi:hypothetical protein
VLHAQLTDQTASITKTPALTARVAVAGAAAHGSGRLAVLGDASCADDAHLTSPCVEAVVALAKYASEGAEDALSGMDVLKTALNEGVSHSLFC